MHEVERGVIQQQEVTMCLHFTSGYERAFSILLLPVYQGNLSYPAQC